MTTSTGHGAGELIRAGKCTAACLLAQGRETTACRCNCAGTFHGRLAAIEIDGYSTKASEHLI